MTVAERHPHLGTPAQAGRVRVDMHTHTMWSGDSTTTPEEVMAAVVGLDVVCITDHHAIAGAQRLAGPLAEECGCRVVVGEEIRTTAGEIIGLFLDERVPTGMTPVDTARAIRDQGGVVYIPHPFDPMRRHLTEHALEELCDAGLVDAIEGFNAKTALTHLNDRAVAFAVDRGLALGAGSDAHVPDAFGAGCVEMPDFADAAGFLLALADGRLLGRYFDEPRPWTPRIIPSTGGPTGGTG